MDLWGAGEVVSSESQLRESLAGAFYALAQLAAYYSEMTWRATVCTVLLWLSAMLGMTLALLFIL